MPARLPQLRRVVPLPLRVLLQPVVRRPHPQQQGLVWQTWTWTRMQSCSGPWPCPWR